tara:strand:- start:712 stop:1851 length:1140 start_codon:yes stop_codon:yes gene_type:complete
MIKLIKEKLTHRTDDPCYLVGGEKLYSKYYANLKAQQKCITDDPNELWGHIKFENYINHKGPEPTTTIRELYKQRAIQIREQNEYVRIWASGGADSTSVIHTFHEAGVQPDELATYMQYPGEIHGSQNAEVDFSLRPLLKEVQKWWPNIKIKFYDILPEHYNWYTSNEMEHWFAYRELNPSGFAMQIPYEVYPELQEHSAKYQTANIYSGADFSIGVDKQGWYYRFVDFNYNNSTNAPYITFFFTDTQDRDLLLKMVYYAKKHILKNAEYKHIPFEDQILGEWGIKLGGVPEMEFWLPDSDEFGRKKNKANWKGLFNCGPKSSLRLLNMVSSVTGQESLMNTMHYYKEIGMKYPHWFTNNTIMENWIGSRTDRVYFENE